MSYKPQEGEKWATQRLKERTAGLRGVLEAHAQAKSDLDLQLANLVAGKVSENQKAATFGGTFEEYSEAILIKVNIRMSNSGLEINPQLKGVIDSQIQQLGTLVSNATVKISDCSTLMGLSDTTTQFLKANSASYDSVLKKFVPQKEEHLEMVNRDNNPYTGTFNVESIITNLSSTSGLPLEQKITAQALFELKHSVDNQITNLSLAKKTELEESIK